MEAIANNTGFSIYHDVVINATNKEVFDRIVEPEHLKNWWPLSCSGKPKMNEIYNFYFDEEYDWYGKVINIQPLSSFHIKMEKSDPDWDPTSFGFDLEEIKSGVQLKFWHEGWPKCNTHFKRSSYCWAMLLNGLKNYTEKGIIVPFSERE